VAGRDLVSGDDEVVDLGKSEKDDEFIRIFNEIIRLHRHHHGTLPLFIAMPPAEIPLTRKAILWGNVGIPPKTETETETESKEVL
jgi:hypothetical protein